MAEVIRMPKMSDTMTEGVIVEWHKKVGDKVKSGDVLAEIETDKAVMEYESFQEGTLLHIGAEKGQTVKVDDVIAVIGKEGEDYKAALGQGSGAQQEKKEAGDGTKEEETKEKESPKGKEKPKEQPAAEKEEKEEKGAPKEGPEKKEEKPVEKEEEVTGDSRRVKASPLAKKIATDSGVSISKIKGTGDDGRIVRRDVEKFLSESPSTKAPATALGEESYEEIPLSMMRKTIARRLGESMYSAPHFYLTMEINMDRCAEARAAINEKHPDQKISFNDIIIKAAALALKQNIKVNSSWLGDKIRYNHHVHMGLAVAVEEGLLVPVIRFADQKSLSQIGDEARELAGRARQKKLQPEEMQGNTFTISNLGMMDIDAFTAIINPPDSCILAVGKIKKVPAVVKDQLTVASILTVTMSCDHRAVDGATGAQFLQTFKSFLENPLTMLY